MIPIDTTVTTIDAPPHLRVRNLSKRFGTDHHAVRKYGLAAMRDEIVPIGRTERPSLRPHEFWALSDVSFDVAPGEALGVVGNNGAGKTTLLRLLQGITRPDWGSVEVRGKSSAIIELGTAFDEFATGRQAIATEGAVLGLRPRRHQGMVEDEIIEFAELQDVADAPIRTYSLGMRLRLAYAIAVRSEPDLLIVDEVLAVGDVAFQNKCIRFIQDHLDRGGSLVLVSHSMWQIRSVCTRCLLLEAGSVVADGPAQDVVQEYLGRAERTAGPAPSDDGEASVATEVSIVDGSLRATDGTVAVTHADAVLELVIENHGRPIGVRCAVAISPLDTPIAAISADSAKALQTLPTGRSRVRCVVRNLILCGATYALRAALLSEDGTMIASVGVEGEPKLVTVAEPPGTDQTPQRIAGVIGDLQVAWPVAR